LAAAPRFAARDIPEEVDRQAFWEVAARQANEVAATFTTFAIHADVTIRAEAQRARLSGAAPKP
jgi:hypothetical protein